MKLHMFCSMTAFRKLNNARQQRDKNVSIHPLVNNTKVQIWRHDDMSNS